MIIIFKLLLYGPGVFVVFVVVVFLLGVLWYKIMSSGASLAVSSRLCYFLVLDENSMYRLTGSMQEPQINSSKPVTNERSLQGLVVWVPLPLHSVKLLNKCWDTGELWRSRYAVSASQGLSSCAQGQSTSQGGSRQ